MRDDAANSAGVVVSVVVGVPVIMVMVMPVTVMAITCMHTQIIIYFGSAGNLTVISAPPPT